MCLGFGFEFHGVWEGGEHGPSPFSDKLQQLGRWRKRSSHIMVTTIEWINYLLEFWDIIDTRIDIEKLYLP